MAQSNNSAMSRLAQVQMKFQQKQMQEREKKKLELSSKTKADSSVESTSLGPTSRNVGNGKVRQMFDERRRGAGIDRSNPLKPIVASSSKELTSPQSSGSQAFNSGSTVPTNIRRRSAINSSSFALDKNSATKGMNSLNKNLVKLSIQDTTSTEKTQSYDDQINNNAPKSNATTAVKAKAEIPLKPVVVKKAPTKVATSVSMNNEKVVKPIGSARKSSTSSNPPSTKTSATKIALSIKPPPRVVTPPPGMATCQFCCRNFNEDRLAKHQEVCKKMNTKKRKIFDATKQRVKGTEAEVYVKRAMRGGAAAAVKATPSGKKADWRLKHEEFIAAIRNAKKVQAHLAKGGKLSDLPPAPVSVNPDYIQCPHCSRRFNQGAAERHIPKCATMRHNKPKPGAKK